MDSNEQSACPFCGAALEHGSLQGGQHRLRWFTGEVPLLQKVFAGGGEKVGSGGMAAPRLEGYRCVECRKMFLDY
ncbi:MAG: PF20097 family protein [Pirellulaceae bacterium]|nr:PF20097 family protein [Pirellulaceae bacterium]